MTGLRAAIGFLTRVPVRTAVDPVGAVAWFPLVGAGVGALSGVVFWLVSLATNSVVAATAAVAAAVLVTGAFHEDGLADTFDGLSVIRTPQRQLEIMRDSRLGTFGVSALVLVLVARLAAVAELGAAVTAVATLAWLHAVAAAVVIGVMLSSRPAEVEGSGAEYLRDLKPTVPLMAVVATVGLGWLVVESRLWAVVAGAVIGPVVVSWWAHRRLGGVTGDVLGACQQLALVGGLAIVAV